MIFLKSPIESPDDAVPPGCGAYAGYYVRQQNPARAGRVPYRNPCRNLMPVVAVPQKHRKPPGGTT